MSPPRKSFGRTEAFESAPYVNEFRTAVMGMERARVGFDDGTVFSLPSRVAIAPALAQQEQVIDFVQLCGQQLALGSSGLYRLEPVAGQSVGRWAPVTLPTGFGDAGFQGGRAHAAGNTLYVFTREGDAASWVSSSCP